MHCSDFHHRLEGLLDDRKNPTADPLLASHAAHCPACHRLLNDSAVLLGSLSKIKTPRLDGDFARRVVASAAPLKPRVATAGRTRRILHALGAAMASAAVMLLAISLVWYAHRREPFLVDGNAPAIQVGPRRSGFPNFAVAISPFGNKIAAPRPRPASKVTIADVLLESPRLPARLHTYRGKLDELAIAFPSASQRLDEFEQLSPAIRPLRASLVVIWETLCRTIPTTHSDPSNPPRDSTGFFSFKTLCLT